MALFSLFPLLSPLAIPLFHPLHRKAFSFCCWDQGHVIVNRYPWLGKVYWSSSGFERHGCFSRSLGLEAGFMTSELRYWHLPAPLPPPTFLAFLTKIFLPVAKPSTVQHPLPRRFLRRSVPQHTHSSAGGQSRVRGQVVPGRARSEGLCIGCEHCRLPCRPPAKL